MTNEEKKELSVKDINDAIDQLQLAGNKVTQKAVSEISKLSLRTVKTYWNGATSQGATSQGATSQGASTKGASSQGATSQGASTNGASTKGASTQGATSQGASTKGATTKGASTKGKKTITKEDLYDHVNNIDNSWIFELDDKIEANRRERMRFKQDVNY